MSDFPFLGHGPPKVSYDLGLWLFAKDVPEPGLAAELAASLPADLQDWALKGDNASGVVEWSDSVLYINSGMDVRYLVKALDPEHLSWLPEEVSDAVIERVLEEVMDGERNGPIAPTATDWDVFGAMIAQWVEAFNERCPLWLVVVDCNVKAPGNARHQHAAEWVREHLDELTARHAAMPKSAERNFTAWGAPVVTAYLADGAKPPETTREVLLKLLDGSGMLGLRAGSKLIGMWPKSQRPAVLTRLLLSGHDLGMPLLVAPATHRFLLDDDVYAAAMTPMRPMWPGDMRQQLSNRLMKPKLGEEQSEWLRRMIAVGEARLRGDADFETELRWWLEMAKQYETWRPWETPTSG
ncbi:MAG: hypothetical protein ACI9KE_005731 [Polyangiales bacterium]|jgi:hypothetical protein